ncbi:hypothetical protein M8J76_004683 [Diaphorina citri]|nr:hypothetical protein M8J75_015628 [Diaphorina citri]KAI5740513.1 hypothetical protein M8J76_004683 [Diaphorina citri]
MNIPTCCLFLLLIVSQLCHSIPTQQNRRPPRNSRQASPSGPSGLLELPGGNDDDDDDEEEDETTRRPPTTPRAPRASPSPTGPVGLLDVPSTRRPQQQQQGARIVFQPLGQVAINAFSKGLTSALFPILKNEQPTGIQYGSVPIPMPNLGAPNEDGSPSTSQINSATSVVSSFMKTLLG